MQSGERDTAGAVREAAEAARTAPPGPDPPRPVDVLLDAFALRFTQGHARAAPALSRALELVLALDERIVGHAADPYHRVDFRQTSRHLTVRYQNHVIADTRRPLALYESGFAPRWYVPRDDVDQGALTPADGQTFCPYKGLASYYDIGDAHRAAWSYEDAWTEVRRVSGLISFEPDKVEVHLDGSRLRLEPGQSVLPHGIDRELTPDEIASRGQA